MTGRIVDREHHARIMDTNRRTLEDMAKLPGQTGVTARLGLATLGSDAWTADEVERGTPDAQIVIASIERAASMVCARAAGLSAEGRETCIETLVSTLRRGFALLDALPPERRSAASVATHPRQ